MIRYSLVVCGGTFDLLHKGHKIFLQRLLETSDDLVIGLTSDKYVSQNKPNKKIKSFDVRKKTLVIFLKGLKAEKRVKIIKINDVYGPLLKPNFRTDALAVSSDKYDVALEINLKRKNAGLSQIKIIKIPIINAEDRKIISATRIRKGVIDKKGKLLLPLFLREKLKKPFGKLMSEIPENIDISKVVTVGDVTTKKFLDRDLSPFLAIVDFKVERKPINRTEFNYPKIINVANSPGTISNELLEAVKNSFGDRIKKVIIVNGEEDLAVLPAIIYAPSGFEIYYGQRNEGLVKINVTEKSKIDASNLLDNFTLEDRMV